ncbi:MAG: hypothetical protein ACYCVH_12360 [Ignavibacteriaceae bacterium]
MQTQICNGNPSLWNKYPFVLSKRFSFLLDNCSKSEEKFIEEIVGNSLIDSLDEIIAEAVFNNSSLFLSVLERSLIFLENKLDNENE